MQWIFNFGLKIRYDIVLATLHGLPMPDVVSCEMISIEKWFSLRSDDCRSALPINDCSFFPLEKTVCFPCDQTLYRSYTYHRCDPTLYWKQCAMVSAGETSLQSMYLAPGHRPPSGPSSPGFGPATTGRTTLLPSWPDERFGPRNYFLILIPISISKFNSDCNNLPKIRRNSKSCPKFMN
jgi:hypothetical protein